LRLRLGRGLGFRTRLLFLWSRWFRLGRRLLSRLVILIRMITLIDRVGLPLLYSLIG
jgi:hypothetical protein